MALREAEEGEEQSQLRRPYSHSDLGFRKWEDQQALDAGACLGLDFGGTLSKIVFFEPEVMPNYANSLGAFLLKANSYGASGVRDEHLSFYSEKMGGRLHFINFETSHTQGAIKMLQKIQHNIRSVHATGGGAFKYSKLVKEKLGIRLMKQDELQTVVRGIVFTLLEHPDSECYTYEPIIDGSEELCAGSKRHHGVSHVDALSYEMAKVPRPIPVASTSFFPLLVVNIGSGVSVIMVTSPTDFKRVSGTAVGGATYFGLCKLLCRCKTFDEALDLAEMGDSRDVNLTVQDIYGGSYDQAGLSGEITAAFFGKAASAPGNVRTKRSRKRPFVSFLEKVGLVILALLSANLLVATGAARRQSAHEQTSLLGAARDVVLLLMPAAVAYLVFWSHEGKLSSSHPPSDPAPTPRPRAEQRNGDRSAAAEERAAGADERSGPSRGRTGGTTSFEEADIARALVVMVAQNVTQIAYLNARLCNTNRVLFTGNFLRHNRIALRALSSMMHNWSRGEIQALFMEHEGYFGALGTFLYSCGVTPVIEEGGDWYPEKRDEACHRTEPGGSVTSSESSSSDEEKNVISDLIYKGEFPRRRSSRRLLRPAPGR